MSFFCKSQPYIKKGKNTPSYVSSNPKVLNFFIRLYLGEKKVLLGLVIFITFYKFMECPSCLDMIY